jgi:transposase
MYLRTTRRKNKDGSTIEYYQLAHNERDPETKKPVAQIIHSFGRADELDRETLVRLCRSIARVCGLKVEESEPRPADKAAEGADAEKANPSKLIRTVSYGVVAIVEALWEKLGIKKTLEEIIQKNRSQRLYERALLAMTANRLCEPESKLGIWDRWLAEVYLPSCAEIKLRQMYEAMDLLEAHHEKIEEGVFFQTADLFNLEVDLIFYDTTTASFAIDEEDEDDEAGAGVRRFGNPKDGVWQPQVVVALAVTREGIPVRSWVFAGNTTDSTTVSKIKADLKGWKLGRALFVADAGMNSEENRRELGRACGKYLLATRLGSSAEVKQEVLTKAGRYKEIHENLQAKEVIVGEGERRRRYILCYNSKEAQRQKQHREEVVAVLEKELARHENKPVTAQWAIELLASSRYKKYLSVGDDQQIRIHRKGISEAEKYDGKWVLETNDDTISLEDAACGYKGLLTIERCFRSLKRTQIKMNPMYHWLPRRIEAHVKICVLALLVERVAELHLKQSWFRIRRILRQLQVSEFQTGTHQFFRRNELTPEVRGIFKQFQIPLPKDVLGIAALNGAAGQKNP